MITVKALDTVGAGIIISANVLFYVRKAVLTRFGHPFQIFDLEMKDGQRLRKAIQSQPETQETRIFKIITPTIWAMLALAVIVFTIRILLT